MKYNLIPLRKKLLEIYQEMDRICERHHLRLFGVHGTAIGAVRHHGFIPWDDDMDVGMPRPDYEEFLKIAARELPSWLKVLSWKNCSCYHNLFAKVIISDRSMVEALCRETGIPAPMGIYVDVFPIDGYPVSYLGRKMRLLKRGLYRWLEHVSGSSDGKCLKAFPFLPRTVQEAMACQEHLLMSCPYDTSKRVATTVWYKQDVKFSRAPRDEWYDAKRLGSGKIVPFEDGTMRIFDDVDVYLRSRYGNYMEWPPESERFPKHSHEDMAKVPWWLGPVKD